MSTTYWDGTVLRSVLGVVERSRHVRTSPDAVDRVAGWMAYEEFAFPRGGAAGEFDVGPNPDDRTYAQKVLADGRSEEVSAD